MAELFDILTFYGDKRSSTNNVELQDIPETYIEIGSFDTPDLPSGRYEIGVSITSTFDRTNKSEFIRWSDDGGTNWNEFSSEPQDKTDDKPHYYAYTKTGYSGVKQFRLEARKEADAGLMTVNFADCWIKRVGL